MFIAADQSSSEKLFVVGSFWLPLEVLARFEEKVLQYRIENKYWREAHYNHIKKSDGRDFDFCKNLLKIALDTELGADFAVIVAANSDKLNEEFHAGSLVKRDVVFMYELIGRKYAWWRIKSAPYVIFDDITHKDCCDPSTEEPEDAVAHEYIRDGRVWLDKYIGIPSECFAPCRSHISPAIQVADLLAGMACLRWRIKIGDCEKIKPNSARLALLEWFEDEIGLGLDKQCLPSRRRMNTWKHVSISTLIP